MEHWRDTGTSRGSVEGVWVCLELRDGHASRAAQELVGERLSRCRRGGMGGRLQDDAVDVLVNCLFLRAAADTDSVK